MLRLHEHHEHHDQWPGDRICSTFNVPFTTGCWIVKVLVWVARLVGAFLLLSAIGCTTLSNSKDDFKVQEDLVAVRSTLARGDADEGSDLDLLVIEATVQDKAEAYLKLHRAIGSIGGGRH